MFVGKSKFPNGNRNPAQRRARYCFLRHIGFNRNLTRALVGMTDLNLCKTLYSINKAVEMGYLNPDLTPKLDK
jgi:hypothetical protein